MQKYKIQFKKSIIWMILIVATVFSVLLFINLFRLFALSLPAKVGVAENIIFIVIYSLIVFYSLTVIFFSRYVFTETELKIYTGLFYTKIIIRSIYGIMSYRDSKENFILYKKENEKKTHLLCLSEEHAETVITSILKANPSVVYEIHRKEEEI